MPLIREAQPADNAALLELLRSSPMHADLTLSIERAPDFFALARARGTGFTLVAEDGAELLGCASVAERGAVLGGKPGSLRVVCDLRTHPARRRQGVGQRLLAALAERERRRAPALYVAATARGNRAVDAALARFGRGQTLVPLASLVSYQLFPVALGRSAPPGDVALEIAPAAASDDTDLCTLLASFHRQRSLAPAYEAGVEELLARSPGLQRSEVLLARRRGRLVTALGVWDPHALKQTRVLGVAALLGLALGAARLLGRVLPLPPVPAVGARLELPIDAVERDPYWGRVQSAFRDCSERGDLLGCYLIQDVVLECFAVSLYRALAPLLEPPVGAVLSHIGALQPGRARGLHRDARLPGRGRRARLRAPLRAVLARARSAPPRAHP